MKLFPMYLNIRISAAALSLLLSSPLFFFTVLYFGNKPASQKEEQPKTEAVKTTTEAVKTTTEAVKTTTEAVKTTTETKRTH
ncbi:MULTISPECIES: hypothetical protein [Leptolyngbya]|uniref:hypothetical protein n=1 Tax=Leptolyngbya TaxID=47251 RepID=UPI001687ED38|nr:hypothetical protein [Leptolyngbya sp. FACHB-1624]MBD1860017.1 hypothetical protein [Leptolyngbya sp. FACHB-1624]